MQITFTVLVHCYFAMAIQQSKVNKSVKVSP